MKKEIELQSRSLEPLRSKTAGNDIGVGKSMFKRNITGKVQLDITEREG